MDDRPSKPEEHVDKPKYRISFETSADSPEELDRKVHKGMKRHMKRGKRKLKRAARR
jgi:hypothetical protein